MISFIFYLIGIIGGELQTRNLQFLAYFFIVFIILIAIGLHYNTKYTIVMTLVTLIGLLSILKNPILKEERFFDDFKNKQITLECEVLDVSHYDYSSYYIVKPHKTTLNNKDLNITGLIKVKAKKGLKQGKVNDVINIQGTLNPFSFQRNPGEFNERKYSLTRNIVTSVEAKEIIIERASLKMNLLTRIRTYYSKAFEDVLPYDEAQIMKTMLLGNKENLDNTIKNLYTDIGLIHVLAISGLHISIIAGALMWILRKLQVAKLTNSIIVVALLWIYAAVVGFGVSTVRAVIMISVLILGDIIQEEYDPITSLAFAGFILLGHNSLYLWDIGFQLSFVSVAALILITPYFNRIFRVPTKIKSVISPVLAVTLCTTPLVAYYFYKVPLIGLITNIILLPFITIVIILGFITMVLYPFSRVLAKWIIGGAYYILRMIHHISSIGVKLPGASIVTGEPTMIDFILYVLFFSLVIYYINIPIRENKLKNNILQSLCVIIVLVIIYKTPNNNLEVTFLDVGQGDSCVIITPDEQTIVVDGGPKGMGARIDDFLRYKGINKIDYMILSHAHLDHLEGLKELALIYDVENLLFTTLETKDYENSSVNEFCDIIKSNDIKTYRLKAGDKIGNKKWTINCLFPFENLNDLVGNDSSAVVELAYGDISYYLTGDIEQNYEGEIAKTINNNNFNVLKVPHHGSKTSSTKEFIESIDPNLAIISCSENNMYNHPSKEVLDRYEDNDIPVYITKDTGAVTITTNSENIKMFKMEDKRLLWR